MLQIKFVCAERSRLVLVGSCPSAGRLGHFAPWRRSTAIHRTTMRSTTMRSDDGRCFGFRGSRGCGWTVAIRRQLAWPRWRQPADRRSLSGFGPYVAAFLAEQNWTQQSIGGVLTAGGFAGLLSMGRRTRSPGVPVGRCTTRDPAARQDASGSSVSSWDG
jgi:hypothetical protein